MGRQQVPVSSCASPHVKAEVLVSVLLCKAGGGGGGELKYLSSVCEEWQRKG